MFLNIFPVTLNVDVAFEVVESVLKYTESTKVTNVVLPKNVNVTVGVQVLVIQFDVSSHKLAGFARERGPADASGRT